MYTGTLIEELMATVERAQERAKRRQVDEELHEIFAMQIPIKEDDQIFMGAA
jgi:hypothetical protein